MSEAELFLALFIAAVGFVSSLFAGIVGVGAVLLIAPLLYFGTPLLGTPLDFKAISNLTTFAVVVGALRGIFIYRNNNLLRGDLVRPLLAPSVIGSSLGVLIASAVTSQIVQIVFAVASITGAAMALLPYHRSLDDTTRKLEVNTALFGGAAGIVGIVGGLAGAGGGFLLLPMMTGIFHLPTRIAIAAAAVSGTLIAVAAFVGRIALVHLDWVGIIAIGFGAYAGSDVGTRFQQRVPTLVLRRAIACVVGVAAFQMILRIA